MDKQNSRRNETLKGVEELLKITHGRRDQLLAELAEFDAQRADLSATIEIVTHQAQGLEEVIGRANSPRVEAVDYDVLRSTGAINKASIVERWNGR